MDAVLGILVGKLLSDIENEARHVIEYPEQFKKTKKELLFIQRFINDIDKINLKDQKEVLKRVTQKLRELVYDAEDIIADCELLFTQEQRKQASRCMTHFSLRMLKYRYQMGKKLGKINQDIGDLKEDMKSFLGPALSLPKQEHTAGGSNLTKYPVLINETEIVGLDDDAKKIKGWVFEASIPLTIIGIVGMGGIGKTTLSQKVYDNESVKKYFDCSFLVTVSQNFELEEIIKNILRKLNVNEDSLKIDTYSLLEKLRCQLNGMKYLVILDDVWGTNAGVGPWWTSLKSAFSQGSDGSCVIVTTRNEEVARSMGATESHIHQPQILSDEDSWLLFSKHAFVGEEGRCPNPYLEDIGKEIVSQCGGLPLAIKVMGGMLSRKGHSLYEWRRVSNDLKEKLTIPEKEEKVIPILQLSYEELPMHLKPCIMYTSLFPEDSVIFVDDMIFWWIGEGFVQGKGGRTAYEVGEECFDELRSRCLLIGVDKDEFKTKFTSYRVHDLIREMIIKIAREENFVGLDDRGRLSFGIHSRRASIMNDTNLADLSGINSKLLRALVVRGHKQNEQFVETVGVRLCQLNMLRVLDISFEYGLESFHVDEVWYSKIGLLSNLVHLSIKGCKVLTKSAFISNLHKLQILRLSCYSLTWLPKEIGSLVKLTVLDVTSCWSLEVLPKEIGSLSNLEELSGFIPVSSSEVKNCFLTSELKKLTKLRKLGIRFDRFNQEFQSKKQDLHVLSELKQLKLLRMNYESEVVDLDLAPLQELEVLYLNQFAGNMTPTWIHPTMFPNLLFLRISGGEMTGFSPEFFGKKNESGAWKLEAISLNVKIKDPRIKKLMPSVRLIQEWG